MSPVRGAEDYRIAIARAERTSRPAALRIFRFENRGGEAENAENPIFEFFSRHIQNFVWTRQRFFAKRRRNKNIPSTCADDGALNAGRPRIFLDMTGTSRFYSFGGIARVANKMCDEAMRSGMAIPVMIDGGELVMAKRRERRKVTFRAGDAYVILDTFWHPIEEYKTLIASLRAADVRVIAFVHDVIPALHPTFMGSAFPGYFTRSLFEIVERSDLLLSVSNAAAVDIKLFLSKHSALLASKPIEVVHLGSDSLTDVAGPTRAAFAATIDAHNTFLAVGTICPHKGQYLALAAFDHLWAEGRDVKLVLIGKAEPAFRGISRAITQHAQFGLKLFWFDDASDAELAFAYRNATCLIQPSIAEGFGVPVVEARAVGLPVLASDIPVFREIGGADISYFRSCDSMHLAELIVRAGGKPRTEPAARMRTWEDALHDVVAAVGRLANGERMQIEAEADRNK